ncbi:MAG TPA: iron-containing redox enzyme family protein [Blastocatellia bacterium]|nr:iron-containing redox enzyme family protein [Blastocatellia bacterium]
MISTLKELLAEIPRHPALNNPFYKEWMAHRLGLEELELFARNYGAWVKSFPDALAILVFTTTDLDAKSEYVKTLYSELGYGNARKSHSVLLDNFLTELADKLGDKSRLDRSRLEKEFELIPFTEELIKGEQALYADLLLATGAQLALEWQAYTMLRQLYDGARNYLPLWSNPDEFHEACEYFYIHIGEAEKEHKVESLNAVEQYAIDENSVNIIMEGFHRHLELIANFWRGLHNAVKEVHA